MVIGVKGPAGGGWCVPAKRCDSCSIGAATLYCRPDSAFLCLACDARIHSSTTRHERVWLCDVCEQAPAAVTCKADAAALCVTCDADIHSANPLARRHERVPVDPFFDSADSLVKSSALNLFAVPSDTYSHHCSDDGSGGGSQHYDDVDTASLLIPEPNADSGAMFFPQMDEPFVNFNYPKSADSRLQHGCGVAGSDGVVPVQTKQLVAPVIKHPSSEINCFNMDFSRAKLSSFSFPSQSISQTVSSSSLDVGVVPDGNANSVSDIPYSFGRNMGLEPAAVGGGLSGGATATAPAQPTQLCGMDREARVMRYREKRKNRKFEKTIRYASRKAYAETRPRIKGRFAKRIDGGAESGGLYGSAASALYLGDCQYGVVPSF